MSCTYDYDKGDRVRFSGDFTVSGSYADPTTVTLKIKNPDNSIDTYTFAGGGVSKLSTGRYYKDVTLSSSGQYWYRYEGTGVVSADEGSVTVSPSEFD